MSNERKSKDEIGTRILWQMVRDEKKKKKGKKEGKHKIM